MQFEEDSVSAVDTMHSAKTPGGWSKVGIDIGFAYTPKEVRNAQEMTWKPTEPVVPVRARTAEPVVQRQEMDEMEREREVGKSRSYTQGVQRRYHGNTNQGLGNP